ncbi:MAG: DUF3465 domain-containing protein [Phycisphaerales bacterium]|nr:DUF3465 domain-containing protein [Phycisphaerales bacterium]
MPHLPGAAFAIVNLNRILQTILRSARKPTVRRTGSGRSASGRRPTPAGTAILLVLLALAYWHSQQSGRSKRPEPPQPGGGSIDRPSSVRIESPRFETNPQTARHGNEEGDIARYFRQKQRDVPVTAEGTVVKLLPDDLETADGSSRHQRMIVEVHGGGTILLAHNIDLSPRVPVQVGDSIRFRGEYQWTERGGVVHWTHHDPAGRRQGGWVEHQGKRYE